MTLQQFPYKFSERRTRCLFKNVFFFYICRFGIENELIQLPNFKANVSHARPFRHPCVYSSNDGRVYTVSVFYRSNRRVPIPSGNRRHRLDNLRSCPERKTLHLSVITTLSRIVPGCHGTLGPDVFSYQFVSEQNF